METNNNHTEGGPTVYDTGAALDDFLNNLPLNLDNWDNDNELTQEHQQQQLNRKEKRKANSHEEENAPKRLVMTHNNSNETLELGSEPPVEEDIQRQIDYLRNYPESNSLNAMANYNQDSNSLNAVANYNQDSNSLANYNPLNPTMTSTGFSSLINSERNNPLIHHQNRFNSLKTAQKDQEFMKYVRNFQILSKHQRIIEDLQTNILLGKDLNCDLPSYNTGGINSSVPVFEHGTFQDFEQQEGYKIPLKLSQSILEKLKKFKLVRQDNFSKVMKLLDTSIVAGVTSFSDNKLDSLLNIFLLFKIIIGWYNESGNNALPSPSQAKKKIYDTKDFFYDEIPENELVSISAKGRVRGKNDPKIVLYKDSPLKKRFVIDKQNSFIKNMCLLTSQTIWHSYAYYVFEGANVQYHVNIETAYPSFDRCDKTIKDERNFKKEKLHEHLSGMGFQKRIMDGSESAQPSEKCYGRDVAEDILSNDENLFELLKQVGYRKDKKLDSSRFPKIDLPTLKFFRHALLEVACYKYEEKTTNQNDVTIQNRGFNIATTPKLFVCLKDILFLLGLKNVDTIFSEKFKIGEETLDLLFLMNFS